MNRARGLLFVGLSLSLSACGNEKVPPGTSANDDAGNTGKQNPACVPDREVYETTIAPSVERYCLTCHKAPPAFGAPFALDTFDAFLANNKRGEPVLEHVLHLLRERIMPPSGQPQPSDLERDAILRWASCDQESPSDDHDSGSAHHESDGGSGATVGGSHGGMLMASRDPYVSPTELPTGASTMDLTLNGFTPSTQGDTYKTRSFSSLVTEDAFIRRMEPIIDDERVVHHLTLRFSGTRQGYLYVWAPGGNGFQFPEGGIRVSKGDTVKLEIHYHNGIAATDVKDSSGVRVYFAAPLGTEYGVANLASWNISVPPNGTSSAMAKCTVENQTHVLAALPHMHEIGDSFSHVVTRKSSGAKESIIELTGWSFHQQRAYAVDMDLEVGDVLDLKCIYVNPNPFSVNAGIKTTDEMCFDFLYVTPPTALASCNDRTSL